MNNIQKAFDKEARKENSKIRKWWRKNDYKVYRVLLFWIYIPLLCYEKLKDISYNRIKYSNERTEKYLTKVLPTLVLTCQGISDFILFTTYECDYGIEFYWDLTSSWLRRKYKKEVRYFRKFYNLVEEYINDSYQIDGYKKMIIDNCADWYEARDKFDLPYIPDDCDYHTGVIFYEEDKYDTRETTV